MTYLNELLNRLISWAKEEAGQTLVEYSLIIALVSVGLVLALTTLRGDISGVFGEIGTALAGAVP